MSKKKGLLITLLIIFLLVSGAGGYLLWRVNQEKTVAPEDSDAGLIPPVECLQRTITVSFSQLDSEEGKLEVTTSLGKAQLDTESNQIVQTFKDSCDEIDRIKAVPKEGYTFLHWEDIKNKRKTPNPEITLKYNDFTSQGDTTLRAVYKSQEEGLKYTVTYTPSCSGYKGDAKTLLTCGDPARGVISADTSCLSQKVAKGQDGKPVYVISLQGNACSFKYWEVDGKNVGSENPHIQKGVEGNVNIKAIFEYVYNGSPFSLKYSSRGEGYLKVDGQDVRAYPVTVQFAPGYPYPKIPVVEAVAKEGWVFERWESNASGFSSFSDSTNNPRKDPDRRANLDIVAVYTPDTPDSALRYKLRLLVNPVSSGKVLDSDNKDITNKTLTITPSAPDVSVRAVANSGYKFVEWSDGKTENPKQIKITGNLILTAKFEREGTTLPSDPDNPETPERPTTPSTPSTPGTSTTGSGTTRGDSMPQTSAFSNKSLYIITVGTLVLCLGMIWQYIPRDIYRRLKNKK